MTTALVPVRSAIARATGGPLPEYVRPDEAHRALETLQGDEPRMRRAHAFLRCLWELGPRPSELCALKVRDIDFTASVVRFSTLKKRTRKGKPLPQRVVPIKPGLLGELALLLRVCGLGNPDDAVFPWRRCFGARVCRRALLAAGVESARANPRAMRHGFAVHCTLSHVPVNVLQEWLGHSSLLTTSIYTRMVAGDAAHWHASVEF